MYGQKIPLATLRKKLLKKHMKYMRLLDDHAIAQLTREQLLTAIYKVDPTVPETTLTDKLQALLAMPKGDDIWHYGMTMLPSSALGF